MSSTFESALSRSVLVFDGATGTEIYRRGVFTNQCYDELNLRNRKMILEIAASYVQAGVDVITTNTYGANRFALERYGLETQMSALNRAGVEISREAAGSVSSNSAVYVAGSIGYPSVETLYRRSRSEIVDAFAAQITALTDAGVDLLLFESQPSRETAEIMTEAYAQSGSATPYAVSYGLDPKLFQSPHSLETRAKEFARLFRSFEFGATGQIAWGLNCLLGPNEMLGAVQEIIKTLALPLIVQPNAGAPQPFEGRQFYYSSPEYLATYAMRYVELGASAVGGCCGTTPTEMAEVVKMVKPTSRSRHRQIVLLDAQEGVAEQPESPISTRSRLADKLSRGEWVQTVETIPPCGYDLTTFIDKARTLREAGIDAVNLPDGPRASARIASIVAAEKALVDGGIEPVLHVCCRDRNLIGLQSELIGCAALKINNLLFITGDPPKLGAYPNATGVFDCDAIGLCALQRRLNRGVDLGGQSLGAPTNAFFGVGFDPSALDRAREISRLRAKIESGALFAVTQPVFDPTALLSFLDEVGEIPIPVIAGVWPFISYRNALFMRKEVPGVVVPENIMSRMEEASSRSKEDQIAAGVDIARESLAELRPRVQGVQVSAPLGRIDISLQVLEQ